MRRGPKSKVSNRDLLFLLRIYLHDSLIKKVYLMKRFLSTDLTAVYNSRILNNAPESHAIVAHNTY